MLSRMGFVRSHFYSFLIRLLNRESHRLEMAHGRFLTEAEVEEPEQAPEVDLQEYLDDYFTSTRRLPEVITEMTPMAAPLYELIPHYCAFLFGPVPFGSASRIRVEMDYIFAKDREEAEAWIWNTVQGVCEVNEHPFKPEEWDLMYLGAFNCN